jgi:hypothetical protein
MPHLLLSPTLGHADGQGALVVRVAGGQGCQVLRRAGKRERRPRGPSTDPHLQRRRSGGWSATGKLGRRPDLTVTAGLQRSSVVKKRLRRCGATCRSLRRRLGPGTDDGHKPARQRSAHNAAPAAARLHRARTARQLSEVARVPGEWAADLYRRIGREPRRGMHAKAVGLVAALRRAALLLGQMGLAGPGGHEWVGSGPRTRPNPGG